jgi:hypothetical protein
MLPVVMHSYRFKNLNIKHEGLDFLVNGLAHYVIEDYEEDGKQAGFETAEIYDALGAGGYVTSKEVLGHLADTAVSTLNQDSHLTRILGNKI